MVLKSILPILNIATTLIFLWSLLFFFLALIHTLKFHLDFVHTWFGLRSEAPSKHLLCSIPLITKWSIGENVAQTVQEEDLCGNISSQAGTSYSPSPWMVLKSTVLQRTLWSVGRRDLAWATFHPHTFDRAEHDFIADYSSIVVVLVLFYFLWLTSKRKGNEQGKWALAFI